MLKTIEGIYRDGQIQLTELPEDVSGRSQVLVTFLDPSEGETIDELMQNIRGVIEMCLEELEEELTFLTSS